MEWIKANSGLSVAQIKKKNLVDCVRGISSIVDVIDQMSPSEYLIIPINQQLFPLRDDRSSMEMTSKSFKKHGLSHNLNYGTKANVLEKVLSPQQLALDTITKNHNLEFNDNSYSSIVRRGVKWMDTSSRHKLWTDVDLMRGFNLASLIIENEFPLYFLNRGRLFHVKIPSSSSEPVVDGTLKGYDVLLYNLVTDSSDLSDWMNIDGNKTLNDDDLKKIKKGWDMYSAESSRTVFHEWRMDFQYVAASVLRQKLSLVPDTLGREGDPILYNILPLPSKEFVDFFMKLSNNVLIEYGKRNGNETWTGLKKLNTAEAMPLMQVKLFKDGVESCYKRDDSYDSLDETIANFGEMRQKYVS